MLQLEIFIAGTKRQKSCNHFWQVLELDDVEFVFAGTGKIICWNRQDILLHRQVLQRRQGMTSGGLTIKEVNDALDRLSASDTRSDKASVLSSLIKKTNALEMKWLLMIIIKDLKLGISEKSIFHEFHPDAEDLFNVTCDLKWVCEKLNDRSQRHKRQDIEVGKAVRPQLAMRVGNASSAWKKLNGKPVVAECKFDGDRIQIHKNGEEIHFFSRTFLDHSEYTSGMSKFIKENILVDRCILDGEMLVWDTALNRFAEFGSNQEIAKAASEGLETNRQLCYIAFDILYSGDTSVIHQSLSERHEILRKVVKPLKGRLEILVPTGGLNTHRPPDEPCWSIFAPNIEDVEKFFKETVENRDEGIVLKDLDSKWEPGDRTGKWLKLKPDYIHAGADLDVIIIGGYYGSGRRGGEVFAAPYCLRFPRIQRVRYDKPWHECLDVQSFVEIVHSSNGSMHKAEDDKSLKNDNLKNPKINKRGEKKNVSIIPSHLMKTDISGLKGETLIFANTMFYFVNTPPSYNLDYFHKLVVENGGSFSMNLNDSVTHCIAAEKKGIKYQAAIRHGRIIHYSWILDCCKQKILLRLQPKYILFLADFARHKFPEEIDSYADFYYWDIDVSDLKQIFINMDKVTVDPSMVHRYKKKYYADERFCFFQGCCVYLYHAPLVNEDYNVISDLALKRVKQDLTMHGGQYCSSLAPATHLVIVSVLEVYNFDILYKSFSPAERRYLHDKRLHVVSNKWLEDSVEKQMKLPETAYNLKPDTLEEIQIERSEEKAQPSNDKTAENEGVEISHVKHARKRGRAASSSSRTVRAAPRPVRTTRARRGNKQAKIDDGEPEEDGPGETGQDDAKSNTDHISRMEEDNSDKDQRPPQAAPRPVRRTSARRGTRQAKIDYRESDESGPGETGEEDQKVGTDAVVKMEEDSLDQDQGPPAGAQFITLDEREPRVVKLSAAEKTSSPKFESKGTSQRTDAGEGTGMAGEKIEQMVDPLHAMLLDMIPSLREDTSSDPPTKVEHDPPRVRSSTLDNRVPVPETGGSASNPVAPAPRAGSSSYSAGVLAPDPNPAAPKKKKVSYKDLADEFLKDW
ncbi:hypothetical protein ACQJBY_017561 [Aegilops geniculata]